MEVTNHPQGDPATILLRKRDADTNADTPQGGAGLESAEFTIRYYKGQYTEGELIDSLPVHGW